MNTYEELKRVFVEAVHEKVCCKDSRQKLKEDGEDIVENNSFNDSEGSLEEADDESDKELLEPASEDKSVELFLDGEPKKIVNCTPHAVTLMLKDGSQVIIPASNNLARCESRRATVYAFDNGVEVHRTEMGDVYGLPEPVEGTYYLVSLLVANKLKGERDDLLVTDDTVRGEGGKIIGCRAFAVVD